MARTLRHVCRPPLCVLLALLLPAVPVRADIDYATAHLDRQLKAVRTTERISIDGRLSEAAWVSAPMATDFTQSEPKEGTPSVEHTEIRVLYDGDNIYFGIRAGDSQVGQVVVSDLKKDFAADANDTVEVVLDTFHDERNGYIFSTNAAGAKYDAQMANEGREVNSSWDGVWYVKTGREETAWVAEMAIPFRTLKFRSSGVQTWGINFHRNLRSGIRNEDSYWSPLPRIYSVQRVSLAGTLEGLSGIQPGSNIRIKPYVSTSLAQAGATAPNKGDGDLGVDLKYGVTSGLTLDLTYNTDFSQVEADEQQINLTRFSLFFPEKREFFLESSGIFRFGEGGAAGGGGGGGVPGTNGRLNPIQNDVLFFSRSIGLSSTNQAVPILGGGRLTGRAGPYEIGFLNIQQREYKGVAASPGVTAVPQSPATNFTVARVRRNILANSDIGAIVMNKDGTGLSGYNRVVGTDANFRFRQAVTLNGSFAKAVAPGLQSGTLQGRIGAGYQDRVWQFSASYADIGENFVNEMGFQAQRGVKRYQAQARPLFRIARTERWMRNISPHVVLDDVTDRDGRTNIRLTDYHLAINFQNGGWLEAGYNPTAEVLKSTLRVTRDARVAPGAYDYGDYFVTARSDPSRRIQLSGRVGTGKFYDGNKDAYTLGGTLRLSYKFNTLIAYTRNNISLPAGRFNTNLMTARVNYAFTTAMFLNALLQYNSDSQQWSTNLRFNIIHRPLSDFFLVYNDHRNSETSDLQDRSLIAKFTYMVSR